MQQFFHNVWRLIKALCLVITLVVTPAVKVIRKALMGERISLFELAFALWRMVVWVSFCLCVTSVIGVPPMVVYMVLMDIMLIATQAIFSAVK
jgi:hypothetical protein